LSLIKRKSIAAIRIYGRQEKYTEFGKLYLENLAYWENDIKTILIRRGAMLRYEQDLSGSQEGQVTVY
jgi:hypothetical protein